jgi:O-antigen/teichoic acid export membrane protein
LTGARQAGSAAGSPADVSRRRATLDVLVQIAGQVGNVALGVVVTLLIVRGLGPARFGEWSTILAVVGLLGYLVDLRLESVAVRHVAAQPERESDWIGALLTLSLAIAVPVTLGGAAVLAALSNDTTMRVAGLVIAVSLVLAALSHVRAVFSLRVRNHISVGITTLNSLLWAGAVIAITAAGGGMVPLAVGFTASAAVSTTVAVVLALRIASPRLRGSRRLWPALARVGFTVGLAGLITLAYAQIDQILVFQLAGAHDAGLYGAVYRFLGTATFIPGALMTTLLPIVSAAHVDDLARVRRLVQSALDYLAMASLPLLAFTIVAAEPLVRLLFGAEFAASADALPVLMGAFVAICWGFVAGNMVIVLDLQRRFLVYAVLALILNVGLNFALIPDNGFLAAAWVTLITEVLVNAVSLRLVLRKLDMRVRLGRAARAAAAATVAGLLVWALDAAGLPVLALIGVMTVAYPALLLASRAISVKEARDLLARRTGTATR